MECSACLRQMPANRAHEHGLGLCIAPADSALPDHLAEICQCGRVLTHDMLGRVFPNSKVTCPNCHPLWRSCETCHEQFNEPDTVPNQCEDCRTAHFQKVMEQMKKNIQESRSKTQNSFNTEQLFCFGCAHSAASEPFPGMPSGERPCAFCIRNPEVRLNGATIDKWYDQSLVCYTPMDAYQTMDMKEQHERWERKAKGDPNWNAPDTGIRFG